MKGLMKLTLEQKMLMVEIRFLDGIWITYLLRQILQKISKPIIRKSPQKRLMELSLPSWHLIEQ
nr:MAG TPA: hypothetical protein [Caudoviricetes sp.]